MLFNHFQNFNPIDLLIEERTFNDIRKLKKDYDARLKNLALHEGVEELKPKRDWLKKTYSLLVRLNLENNKYFNDNQIYHAKWFIEVFNPLNRLVREIDFAILDDEFPDPIIPIDTWCNDALFLLRANWGKPENFQVFNSDPIRLSEIGIKPAQIKGSCFDQANQIYNNWDYVKRSGEEWEKRWREVIHIYNAFLIHFDPEHKLDNAWLINKYPELSKWANSPEHIPDKEEWENGLLLARLQQDKPKVLKTIWSDGRETICTDTEYVNYLRNIDTSNTNNSNIIPTEFMTNTKLAILESGFASIEKIKRPAERRLALQDLQKEMKVSPKEFNCLIHELTIEKSEVNNNLGTFEEIMKADIDQELLVENLIMSGTVSMIAAEVGTGKSSLFYQIMESVSTGSPLFGKFNTKKSKVLVIQCDETFINAKTKFKKMDLRPDNKNCKFIWEWSPSQIPELEEEIKVNNWDLVFMDSFGKIFGEASGDMNTAECGFYMYQLNQVAAKTKSAILVAHHLKKEQGNHKRKDNQPRIPTLGDFFGSGYITAGVRDAWGLWQKGEDLDGTPMFGLKYLKNNSGLVEKGWVMNLDGCIESERFSLSGGAGGFEELDNRQNLRSKLQLLLKQKTPDWISSEQLIDQILRLGFGVDVNPRSVKRELLNLVNDAARTGIERRKVSSVNKGRPTFEYRFIR